MAPESHENHLKVTLNTIRRVYRRNSRVTLYKLVQKNLLKYHVYIVILMQKNDYK